MTFWQAFKNTYRGSIAFLIACPILAFFPVAFEILQHAVEIKIGMYDSIAAAKAMEHHPLRMGFGMLKIVALSVATYWITRFMPQRDARFAATVDPLAIRLFAGYLAFGIGFAAIQLFALPQTGGTSLLSFLVGQIVGSLLIAWGVASTFGNASVGPVASIRIMARHLPWTFAFTFVVMMPVMIPHYGLGAFALLGPKSLLWPTMIVDSLLVGWLTAVICAGAYYAAIRAAKAAGVDLSCARPRSTLTFVEDI